MPWLDALAGATFLVLGLASIARSRRFAALALAAAAAWFAGGAFEALLLVHRPLMLQVAFGYPDGRVRDRYAQVVIGVAWFGAVVQAVGLDARFMLVLGSMALVQAGRMQWRSSLRHRAFAATAAPAAGALGLSLAVPAAGRLWAPQAVAGDGGLIIYTTLVIVAALFLLTGVVIRGRSADTDVLIELSEATPGQTLSALRAELADGREFAARAALQSAAELLEANAELQTALARRVEEVRHSRRRIVAATVAERQRLESILSSGASRYLDELATTLTSLRDASHPQADELVAAALEQVAHSRDDLEHLARGFHPRVLGEQGLGPAITDLAERCPLKVDVRVPEQRYPEPIESAIWYACAEALANVVKHSRAQNATVVVTEHAGELVADVRDDGVGGAELHPGGGLVGLSDRLGAVDGSVSVSSGNRGGTRVQIKVPVP